MRRPSRLGLLSFCARLPFVAITGIPDLSGSKLLPTHSSLLLPEARDAAGVVTPLPLPAQLPILPFITPYDHENTINYTNGLLPVIHNNRYACAGLAS